MSGRTDLNTLLAHAHKASTLVQAISGLTQSDQCAVPAHVINELAEISLESLIDLIEGLSAKRFPA